MAHARTANMFLDLRFLLPLGLHDRCPADPFTQTSPCYRYAKLLIQSLARRLRKCEDLAQSNSLHFSF